MKRKTKTKKAATKKENNLAYKAGDFCYYIDANDRVGFAEIRSVNENYEQPVYNIVDQTSFRFLVIEHMFCSDEESYFKKKKRKTIREDYNVKRWIKKIYWQI